MIIVKDYDSATYRAISLYEFQRAEDNAGPNSAFVRSIDFNSVSHIYRSVDAYLAYLNR